MIKLLPLLLLLAFAWTSVDILFQGPIWTVATDVELLTDVITNSGQIGWLVYVAVVIVEVILAPIPSFTLYSLGALLFGTTIGTVLTVVGNLLGAGVSYWLGMVILHSHREKLRFEEHLRSWGPLVLFVLRIIPFTSSDFLSYIAGSLKMGLRGFLIATALGTIPFIILQSFFSAVLNQHVWVLTTFMIVNVIYVVVMGYLAYQRIDI